MTRTRKCTSVYSTRKRRRILQRTKSVGVQIPSIFRTEGFSVCRIVQHVQESALHRGLHYLKNYSSVHCIEADNEMLTMLPVIISLT